METKSPNCDGEYLVSKEEGANSKEVHTEMAFFTNSADNISQAQAESTIKKENDFSLSQKENETTLSTLPGFLANGFVDVSPYTAIPQDEAAKLLGIKASTLSKRWKEATIDRKWPHRKLCKINKELLNLKKNILNSPENKKMINRLHELLSNKAEEEAPVFIKRIV